MLLQVGAKAIPDCHTEISHSQTIRIFITLRFLYFVENCADGISVNLDTKTLQSSRNGVYSKNGTDPITGLPVFYQSGGDNALWFKSGMWFIGNDVGTTLAGVRSSNSEQCPELVENDWMAFQDGPGCQPIGADSSIAP